MSIANATGAELKLLREAFLKAFSDRRDLQLLLEEGLESHLFANTGDHSHDTSIELQRFRDEGRLGPVLVAACAYSPNPALKQCAKKLLTKAEQGLIGLVHKWWTEGVSPAQTRSVYEKLGLGVVTQDHHALVDYAWSVCLADPKLFPRFAGRLDALGRGETPLPARTKAKQDDLNLRKLHYCMDKTEKMLARSRKPKITVDHL